MKKILFITCLIVILAGFVPSSALAQTGEISGIIWEDDDHQGDIDSGEQLFGSVKVRLRGDLNYDGTYGGTGEPDVTITTDTNGEYSFTGLARGSYKIKVRNNNFNPGKPLENYYPVYDRDGLLDNITTVNLLVGATIDDVHFGYDNHVILIELSSFTATPKSEKVILEWTTESEIDNAGFNILRAGSEDGEYVQINDSLIPAEGSPTQGAIYDFVDTDANNMQTYYYYLEDIDLNGESTLHGPVSATPRLIYMLK